MQKGAAVYTIIGKANDRFGYHASGKFRCAYKATTPIISAGLVVLGAAAVLIVINIINIVRTQLDAPANAVRRFNEIIYGNSDEIKDGLNLFGDSVTVGFDIIGTFLGIIIFVIVLAAFLAMCIILGKGQEYTFTADEKLFTVVYPPKMNRTLAMEYDYVLAVMSSEWRFPFAPKCLDITIVTKQGSFDFRVIHTPISRVNGIVEIPFNIIKEMIGVSLEKDIALIHKEEKKFERRK